MKQPIEPNKEDCCNSGCNPCIFDVYEKQLALYKKYQETGETSDTIVANAISQIEYTTFIVISNTEMIFSHNLVSFKKVSYETNQEVFWKPGDHFLVKCNSGSCTRAYTPLKLKLHNKENVEFSVIVKRYTNGLVSNYLCDLKPGDTTLWRGPYGSYEIVPNKFSRIIIIAQGTGILPFISIIENILYNEEDMTKVVLYYCCQNIDTVLFRAKLYSLKSYWNFIYKIYISQPAENKHLKYQEPTVNHKLNFDDIVQLKPYSVQDQFLICGSQNFMREYELFLNDIKFSGSIILF
ncbi:NADH-cytochrome b5 reductase-like [Aphomia sociella]